MLRLLCAAGVVVLVSGCGTEYISAYEEGVYDYDPPVYCYSTLADPMCYDRPVAYEDGRLLSYYGPHPYRYPLPLPPPSSLVGPPAVACYVRDRDPVGRSPGGSVEVCQMVP